MKPKRVLACALLLLGASMAHGATLHWIASWGASPAPPRTAMGPLPPTPGFDDVTIRQIVRISAGGKYVRVRFTNEYGSKPLVIGAASIARASASGKVQPGTRHVLTFGGKRNAVIPAGAPLLSDPVDLPVKALSSLAIILYLPRDTGPCTCHPTAMQIGYVSPRGNFTGKLFKAARTITSRAFLSEVDVKVTGPARAIVAFGDSITDGYGSTADTNRRWPDRLAERLVSRGGRTTLSVVNEGISGNRVLADGAGQSALARFDRDVLAVPGAAYVIVFEGINDIGFSYGHFTGPLAKALKHLTAGPKVTAQALIAGYRQLIARAHLHGLKIYGATITPYEGSATYTAQGNAVRDAVNRWIRTSGAFDGVLDFDAVLRDPGDPNRIAPALQAGDHIHGNDAGYAALAKSIDLVPFE
ncbi:MAG: SGNH/GDSL hydrolase family protein [Steroidobacteraceae bacterium]